MAHPANVKLLYIWENKKKKHPTVKSQILRLTVLLLTKKAIDGDPCTNSPQPLF
jgi:hypothetical protein